MKKSSKAIARALYSVYYPRNRSAAETQAEFFANHTHSFKKNPNGDGEGFSKGYFTYISAKAQTRTQGRFAYPRLRHLLAHELSHSMNLSRHDRVAASAWGYYFKEAFKRNGGPIDQLSYAASECVLIEKAFRRTTKRKADEHVRNAKLEEKQKATDAAEHKNVVLPQALSGIGVSLGEIAVIVEIKTRKPGAGAILITQASRGKRVEEVIKAIKRGKYDLQIKQWLTANPEMQKAFNKAGKM